MIVVNSREELRELINQRIKEQGPNCNLNDIDVSGIVDMSFIFYKTDFNGDISKWNVSCVENMNSLFRGSKFDGDISEWNVSNVVNMSYIFFCSPLYDHEPEWWFRHRE